MSARRLRLKLALGLLLTSGCGDGESADVIEGRSLALNACEETVPADRHIDGIPAYAQCTDFREGPIYSNNGVDTSATKLGNDWVETQRSGGYQCTELVHRYWLFKWNSRWLPRGNAGTWCDTQPPASSGVVQTTSPVHGDAIVLAPGSCGAAAGTGHVALVDVVDGARLVVIEQNRARRGTYQQSCAKCFLHLVANDGSTDGGVARPAPVDAGSAPPRADGGTPVPRDAGTVIPDAAQPAVDASASSAMEGDAGNQPVDTGSNNMGDGSAPSTPVTADAQATSISNDEPDAEGCTLTPRTREVHASWNALPLAFALLWQHRRRKR